MARTDHLLTVPELEHLLTNPHTTPVILDVRWTLSQPDGSAEFSQGHIPHARYVSLDDELAGHAANSGLSHPPTAGRHPLPDFDTFKRTAHAWGIGADTPVVIYDNAGGMGAARAWWLLRWVGVKSVRLLDGGWPAWQAAGGPIETGLGEAGPGTSGVGTAASTTCAGVAGVGGSAAEASLTPLSDEPQMPTMTADDALVWPGLGVLLDARAPERFRGETEPLDRVAGHIPGAKNRPATHNTPDGSWASNEQLRAQFTDLGVSESTPVGVYCGSGITACHNAFALALIDQESSLFPASWSGWSADSSRPVATGD